MNNNKIQLQRGEIAVVTMTEMSTGEKSVQRFYVFSNALQWFSSMCEREDFYFEFSLSELTREQLLTGFEVGGVGCDYRIELCIEQEEIEEIEVVDSVDVLTIQDFFAPKVLMTFGRFNPRNQMFTGEMIVESEDGAIQVVSGSYSIEELNFNFAIDCSGSDEDLCFYLKNFGATQFAQDDDNKRKFFRFEDRVFIVTNGRAYCSPALQSLNDAFDFVNNFYPNVNLD
jgi:hypothetical protein